MKERVLIFAGEDEQAASRMASLMRADGISAVALSSFNVEPGEECDKVVIMPDVPSHFSEKIIAAFPGKCQTPTGNKPAVEMPIADLPMMVAQLPKRRGRPQKVKEMN